MSGVTTPTERLEVSARTELPSVAIILAENSVRRWEVLHDTYTVCTGLDIARPAEWRYRKRLHHQTGDGVMLMEPGEVHANTKTTDPASFRVLMIAPTIVERAAQELDVSGIPHFKLAQLQGRTHPEVLQAFRTLHASLEDPSTPLEIQTRFVDCLRLLLEQCTEAKPPSSLAENDRAVIQRARDFIHEHVCDGIRLEEIVEAAGGSDRFQLVRAFSSSLGLPPHAYQIQLRIIKARALLTSGMPAAQVAAELGFADQGHLSRHFTRVLGVTPGSFARATAAF